MKDPHELDGDDFYTSEFYRTLSVESRRLLWAIQLRKVRELIKRTTDILNESREIRENKILPPLDPSTDDTSS